jgi:hypothetical protein
MSNALGPTLGYLPRTGEPFRLAELQPGEEFNRHDGTPCRLDGPAESSAHRYVWENPDSPTQGRRVWHHETAQVLAVSPDQAREWEQRRKRSR